MSHVCGPIAVLAAKHENELILEIDKGALRPMLDEECGRCHESLVHSTLSRANKQAPRLSCVVISERLVPRRDNLEKVCRLWELVNCLPVWLVDQNLKRVAQDADWREPLASRQHSADHDIVAVAVKDLTLDLFAVAKEADDLSLDPVAHDDAPSQLT